MAIIKDAGELANKMELREKIDEILNGQSLQSAQPDSEAWGMTPSEMAGLGDLASSKTQKR